MAKKTYVLDTSVLLTSAVSVYSFGNNDIVIPLKVLEEIDKHKKRQDSVGSNARNIIRIFDELREKGDINKGVTLGEGYGKLLVFQIPDDSWDLPRELDQTVPDHIILQTALSYSKSMSNPNRMIMVSRDINMRVISDSCLLYTSDAADE